MESLTFDQFQAEFFRLYSAGDYAGALAFTGEHGGRFKEHATIIASWNICVAALLGDRPLALKYFQSVLDDGLWFPPHILRDDPDMASLQGDPEFERLVSLSMRQYEKVASAAKPELLLFEPQKKSETYPLMIAMHPLRSTASVFGEHYKFLSSQGWLVASAQSSQIAGDGLYCWDNTTRGAAEIVAHFEALNRQYPIDPQRILLSGFSQGAGLAVMLSMSRQIPATGFIALGPYIPNFDEFASALSSGPIQNLRGYLLIGEREPDLAAYERIETLLKDRAVPYQRKNLAGIGHEIPANFQELIEHAIGFLESQ